MELGIPGLDPAATRLICLPQHFAEKLHALTLPRGSRPNPRVKDLVDLVLLIERGGLNPSAIADALDRTFARRATHPLPERLPDPPAFWHLEYAVLAREAGLGIHDIEAALSCVEPWMNGGR